MCRITFLMNFDSSIKRISFQKVWSSESESVLLTKYMYTYEELHRVKLQKLFPCIFIGKLLSCSNILFGDLSDK